MCSTTMPPVKQQRNITLNSTNMDKADTAYVIYTIDLLLSGVFPDNNERNEVADKVLPEVISDIEETADKNFNDSDIRIALSRVLYKYII